MKLAYKVYTFVKKYIQYMYFVHNTNPPINIDVVRRGDLEGNYEA